ncbi:unknown [Clostridium sp. CAG:221]|nr:unknown [Clostridium sp. CAG:221]
MDNTLIFCELIFFNKALVANDKIQPIKMLIIIVKGIEISSSIIETDSPFIPAK